MPPADNPIATLAADQSVTVGFGNAKSFEFMQRAAKALASSTLVPEQFRSQVVKKRGQNTEIAENPNAIPNCIIALNMANRMGADPLMVMQNLYVVEGRPSWSAQFVIAAINSCGRFSPLRFDLSEPGEEREVSYETTRWENGSKVTRKATCRVRERTCRAWAIEKATGERLDGPEVSMAMAEAEGWLTKNGSKWQTMAEVMFRYRAAAFFGRLYAPELLMGLHTVEEVHDMGSLERQDDGTYAPAAVPPRPTRAQFEDAAVVVENEIQDAEPEQVKEEPYAFVTADGEELSFERAEDAANAFADHLHSASNVGPDALNGLWNSNGLLLTTLREAGFERAADDLNKQYTDLLDSLRKPATDWSAEAKRWCQTLKACQSSGQIENILKQYGPAMQQCHEQAPAVYDQVMEYVGKRQDAIREKDEKANAEREGVML